MSLFRSRWLAGLLAAPSLFAVTPSELAERLARSESLLLVDVRAAHAYQEGHIPGAINIPLSLLPHKPVPTALPVIVYADGLGLIDEQQAIAVLRDKRGVKADVLDGGYAAWLGTSQVSTQAAGVTPERLPVITYDQLVAANKDGMMLVDLSTPAQTAGTGARALSVQTNVVGGFGNKLGVPVVTPGAGATTLARAAEGKTSARSAAAIPGAGDPSKLLVLIADDDASAAEIARQLRSSGHHRFTVLVGGTESIRHEGRTGLGRMDGRAATTQP